MWHSGRDEEEAAFPLATSNPFLDPTLPQSAFLNLDAPRDMPSLLAMGSELGSSELPAFLPVSPVEEPFMQRSSPPLDPPHSDVPPVSLPLSLVSQPLSFPQPSVLHDVTPSPTAPAINKSSTASKAAKPARRSRKRQKRDRGDATTKPKVTPEALDAKRKQRLLRNRASAQLSRERKKAYLSNLERLNEQLTQENARLVARVDALTKENEALRQSYAAGGNDFNSPIPAYSWSPQAQCGQSSPISPTLETDESDKSRHSSRSPSPFSSGGMFFFSFLFALVLFFNLSGGPATPTSSSNGRALMSVQKPHPSVFRNPSSPVGSATQNRPDTDLQVLPEIDVGSFKQTSAKAATRPAKSWSGRDPSDMQLEQYNRQDLSKDEMLLQFYRKLLFRSVPDAHDNARILNSSYFLVPSVFSIQDGRESAGVLTKVSPHAGNLLPTSPSHDRHNDRPNATNSSKIPDSISQGDSVYFWMPLSKSGWDGTDPSIGHSLFEIGCNVNQVRVLSFNQL